MTKKIRKIYNKVKLNERYRTDDKSKSYRISIKKYVSLTLKGMTPSENSFGQVNFRFKKERITEARYGSDAVLYNKKTAKKEGDYFYKCPAFYKGEKKNGKANGWGMEALRGLSVSLPSHTLHTIIQFYEGEWKNGKRNGYGESYNYHPSVGWALQYDLEGERIQMDIEQDNPGIVYKGNWVNGVMEGEGVLSIGKNITESGLFKNGKFWKKKK